MLIKRNDQYELHANLTPYDKQFSLALSQVWPKAQHPHSRQIFQVLLTADELANFAAFLANETSQ